MRTHQGLQKKTSVQKAILPDQALAPRPFAAQRKPAEDQRQQENKGLESTLGEFAIHNPDRGRSLPVQPKKAIERSDDQSKAQPENKTGLPDHLKAGIENLSGIPLDDVKVHHNSAKPAQLNALAYAQGTEIHVAPGQEQHLPHEAWHVVQQKQGRVKPTVQMRGMGVNNQSSLERESDEMGAKALQMQPQPQRRPLLSRNGATVAPASILQLEREPISNDGQNLIKYAKEYFRNLARPTIKRSRVVDAANYLQTQATKFNASKEKNQAFLALINDFKSNLHASPDANIRDGVKQKLEDLKAVMTDEEQKKTQAATREAAEGGHALGRHGPEVSDELLKRRLFTGVAPDNHLSPAPGASSRFNSYKDVLETRQQAAQQLQQAIVAAQGKVLQWLATQRPGLDAAHVASQNDVQNKQVAFNTAKQAKDQFPDKSQPAFQQKLQDFKDAQKELNTAKETEKTRLDEKTHPGKNFKRLLPTLTKIKLTIGDDADTGALEDNVKLVESYSIVVNHNKPIGSGYKSDDADLIKLQDLLNAVADHPDQANPTPKPLADIRNGLAALGVGGDLNAFAAYLNNPASLTNVKAKADKGGKIYKIAQDAGNLTKSFTNFKRGGDGKLFDNADQPLVIDAANWDAIQHFPAANDAAEGIQD
ncbi:MAG TPA: DUF4157 domain-containing protein [Nostocaceae cyanobacterium]|nr:DUF4157 domain-containing protein [Nostocaceae cyanobacterium]